MPFITDEEGRRKWVPRREAERHKLATDPEFARRREQAEAKRARLKARGAAIQDRRMDAAADASDSSRATAIDQARNQRVEQLQRDAATQSRQAQKAESTAQMGLTPQQFDTQRQEESRRQQRHQRAMDRLTAEERATAQGNLAVQEARNRGQTDAIRLQQRGRAQRNQADRLYETGRSAINQFGGIVRDYFDRRAERQADTEEQERNWQTNLDMLQTVRDRLVGQGVNVVAMQNAAENMPPDDFSKHLYKTISDTRTPDGRLGAQMGALDSEIERREAQIKPLMKQAIKSEQEEARLEELRNEIADLEARRRQVAGITEEQGEGDLPEGVREGDVQYTMRKYGLTREQVLDRLGGG